MAPLRGFVSHYWNRLGLPLLSRLPTFGVLEHTGRRSGKTYRIPINAFRRGDHYYFALTYGSDVDWLKNARAAGGCDLVIRGRRIHLVEPELFTDPELRFLPAAPRAIERLNGVTQGVRMRIA